MEHRNIISWNTIFAAYGSGNSGEVMQLLREFDLNGFVAEAVTYLSIVKGCDSLKRGKEIHARAVAAGYKSVVLETALLHMYARCGSLRDAREVFDAMQTKDLVSFNAMMSACAQDESLNAVTLFHKLDLEGFSPSAVTYVAVLTACTAAENLSLGRTLHGRLVSGGVRRNYILDNALLNMYAKCGCFDDAKKVFDAMKERDTTSWNAMIAACALHGRGRDAIELFYVMDAEPTAVTFTNVVNACSDIAEARKLHSRIQSYGMKLEAVTENSLIKMYAKCGSLADAESVFELSSRKNGSSWNCLMAAYIDHSKCLKALKLVRRMDFEGMKLDTVTFVHLIAACAAAGSNAGTDVSRIYARVLGCFRQPEAVVGNALINMYARTGNLDRASRVFEEMPLKNDASWNAIMTAHAQHGEALRALELYHGMELHGEVPCEITLTVVLLACNHAGLQDDAWYHFAFTSRDYGLELGRVHYHCMLDLLGRQGLLEEARHLLSEMPCDAGAAGWRGVLGACRIHGDDSLGAVAAQSVASIEPEDAASYMLLSSI